MARIFLSSFDDSDMAVFKYCDSFGIDVLRNLELKITPPNEFNDPFEFTPHVICTSVNRRFKNVLRDKNELRGMFANQKKVGFKGDFRLFKRQLREMRPTFVKHLEPHMPGVNAELQRTLLDRTSADHGMLCLSSRQDSVLMWGHYCDKHRGVVIGLNRDWDIFSTGGRLREVQYVRDRVIFDTSLPPGSKAENDCIEKMVFTKNLDWGYEHELRQVFILRGLRQRTLADGRKCHFLPIPPQAITSVCLGVRCPKKTEEEVRGVLSNPSLSHVKITRASLHSSEFRIVTE